MISGDIREKLIKVCAVLNKHEVEYIIVGGAAVNYYGHRRRSGLNLPNKEITIDLDFWYNPTIENWQNLLDALDDLKVDTSELREMIFNPASTYLKIPHDTYHTDFLPTILGLGSFRDSKKNAEKVDLEGNELLLMSYGDLIQSKNAVNRDIDRSDIDELDRLNKGKGKSD